MKNCLLKPHSAAERFPNLSACMLSLPLTLHKDDVVSDTVRAHSTALVLERERSDDAQCTFKLRYRSKSNFKLPHRREHNVASLRHSLSTAEVLLACKCLQLRTRFKSQSIAQSVILVTEPGAEKVSTFQKSRQPQLEHGCSGGFGALFVRDSE